MGANSDWERLWRVVSNSPDDFASWEALIKLSENVNGGITRATSEQDLLNVRTVYDHFLAKFPLCFGYWKKYADLELAIAGPPAAEQ
ncbi:hypothetical protein HK096_000845, partial [Nowakowskiella sp. JEL0078]